MAFGLGLAAAIFTFLELGLALLDIAAPDKYEDFFVGFEPGHPLFEKQTTQDGITFYVTQPGKRRFFNEQRFSDPKSPNTYRIFTLGGSTTYGRPYDHQVSFSKWMKLLLQEADPTRSYEVINAGGVSYASYRVVVLMKELVRYEPDLFVVYTGHNEFLEERTYRNIIDDGPVLRALKKGFNGLRTVTLLKTSLAQLKKTGESKPGELRSEVQAKLDVWSGVESFTRDDDLRRTILKHFHFNLQQMVDIARDHDIDILFVNPVSNLKDFSPFKSEHSPSVSPESVERFEALYQEAMTLLTEQEYQEALALLKEAQEISPDFAEVHYRMGQCYLRQENTEEAKRHLTLAKELDIIPLRALNEMNFSLREVTRLNGVPLVDLPTLLRKDSFERRGHGLLGKEYFLDHVHPRIEIGQRIAEWILEAMMEEGLISIERPVAPDRRRALYDDFLKGIDSTYYAQRDSNLGKVLGWAGKNEEAAAALERAFEVMPDDPELLYNLGVAYQKQGKCQRAIERYRDLVGIEPRFVEAYFNLGKCYQNVGAWEDGARSFQKVLELKPDDGKAHYNLALCYRELKRFDEEVSELEKAWAADPTRPELSRLMGSVYLREGRLDDALGAYKENLASHRSEAAAHNDVGVVYRLKGQWPEAAGAASKALELDPGLVDAHRNLALVHEAQGDIGLAEGAFQTIVSLLPSNFEAHFDLGRFYHRQGRLDDAIRAYRHSVGLNPGFAPGYANLGAAYGKQGRLDEAIDAFQKALELRPEVGGAHYHLASLYATRHQPRLARQHFKKAKELGVNVPDEVFEELQIQ